MANFEKYGKIPIRVLVHLFEIISSQEWVVVDLIFPRHAGLNFEQAISLSRQCDEGAGSYWEKSVLFTH